MNLKKTMTLNISSIFRKAAFLCAVIGISTLTLFSCGSDDDDTPPPPTEIANGSAGPLTWILMSDGVLTISGEGKMPSYETTTAPWDAYRSSIKKVVAEDGVASIGKGAFKNYANITEMAIAQSVDSIHTSAFAGCGLTSIVFPEGMTDIGEYAFTDCTDLEDVTFPSSLLGIHESAFAGCTSLNNFTLPALEYMGHEAFAGCTSLTQVTFDKDIFDSSLMPGVNDFFIGCTNLQSIDVQSGGVSAYTSVDGVLLSKSKYSLLECPAGKAGSYVVPDEVTIIWLGAFYDCSKLTSITLPDALETIRIQAFMGCTGLTEITIPANVNYINVEAFKDCSKLTKVTVMATAPPSLKRDNFTAANDVLYVPATSLSAYQAHPDWSAAFSDIRGF